MSSGLSPWLYLLALFVLVDAVKVYVEIWNRPRQRRYRADLGKVTALIATYNGRDVIRETIRNFHNESGWAICPHTATGITLRERLPVDHAVVVATAHPAKFETVVEPLIEQSLELPPALAEVLARPAQAADMPPTLDALREALAA